MLQPSAFHVLSQLSSIAETASLKIIFPKLMAQAGNQEAGLTQVRQYRPQVFDFGTHFFEQSCFVSVAVNRKRAENLL
jgi:alcohol dehydrogenase YqhD (iron-dependent ADH family)